MIIPVFSFVFDPFTQTPWLTPAEHDGLCCLIDRAQQFGGTEDIFFLCVSSGSIAVRLQRDAHTDALLVSGFACKKQHEPWLWIYLPSALRMLFQQPIANETMQFHTEDAPKFDAWLQQQQRGLWDGIQKFARNSARSMHPYSIAFTHIDPSLYSDGSIHWYSILPYIEAEESIQQQFPQTLETYRDEFKDDEAVRIVPPIITRTWRLTVGDEYTKLGRIGETSDWYELRDTIRDLLSEI